MPRPELADRLLARERAAVAEALNLIDDQRPARRTAAETLLEQLEGECGAALRVGLTGPPGAGKSTLIDALVRKLREREQTVGIIAVDPSSSRSGGALLGDRVRVSSRSSDPGVFVRSMAARDRLGGLAEATRAGVDILSASFDVVLVETVGVGQSESDVSSLVDTLVFVAQPSAGDTLQFMKAGLLDRAEKLYREMIELKADTDKAYRHLLDLYITEKSWEEAVECAQHLYKMGDPEAAVVYGQVLCEIAASAIDSVPGRAPAC